MASSDDLLVHNIAELCTLKGGVRRGEGMRDLGIVKNAAVLVRDGFVEEIGPSEKLRAKHRGGEVLQLNANGRAVVPGFVDAHTHAIFAGDRAHEFDLKLSGASYANILAAGGGILYTVRKTRDATRAELLKTLLGRLDRMLEHGTTTAEVKSGYGLDLETERRMLDVARAAQERHPIELVVTFLGAHAIPPEFKSASEYADYVIDTVLPELADEAEFIDVFCEKGVFSPEDSKRILEAGMQYGLTPKIHAEELAHTGGARVAREVGAASADHLLHATDEDVHDLVKAGVVPVLLPLTAFSLGAQYANARAMIDAGAPVALATDLSPNTLCESMPLAMAFACHGMRMTPAEALAAATINAAASLGREEDRGSIEEGKQGDLVIVDAPSHVHIPYHFGVNPVWKVVKMGEIVVDRSERRM